MEEGKNNRKIFLNPNSKARCKKSNFAGKLCFMFSQQKTMILKRYVWHRFKVTHTGKSHHFPKNKLFMTFQLFVNSGVFLE